MSEYTLGLDRAKGDDMSVAVIARRSPDGSMTIIAELRGEAAEYVASLYAENERLRGWAAEAERLFRAYKLLEDEDA